MATLMQKDVLVEFIAGTQALIFRVSSNPKYENFNFDNGIYELPDDYRSLGKLKRDIYSLEPSEIDFKSLSNQIKVTKDRFSLIEKELMERENEH